MNTITRPKITNKFVVSIFKNQKYVYNPYKRYHKLLTEKSLILITMSDIDIEELLKDSNHLIDDLPSYNEDDENLFNNSSLHNVTSDSSQSLSLSINPRTPQTTPKTTSSTQKDLPSNFVTRWEWLYELNDCPLEVGIDCNDFDVWQSYSKDDSKKKWLWMYNKLQLSESLNIKCAPIGVYPSESDYPVIVKPIINLYGSGRGVLKFDSREKLTKFSRSELGGGMFWTPFFTGEHLSIDVILEKGRIKFYTIFEGKKGERLGEYDWWESLSDRKLSSKLKKWIKKTFRDTDIFDDTDTSFTGVIHIETIDNQLVECHLRMGHLGLCGVTNYLESNDDVLGKALIQLYKEGVWMGLPSLYKIPKIFIVPLYVDIDEYQYISNPELNTVFDYINSLSKYKKITMVQQCPGIDVAAHPVKCIKAWTIFGGDLEECMKLRDDIREMMHPKRIVYYISKTRDKLYGLSPLLFQSPFNIAIGAAVVICMFVLVQWIRHFFSGGDD